MDVEKPPTESHQEKAKRHRSATKGSTVHVASNLERYPQNRPRDALQVWAYCSDSADAVWHLLSSLPEDGS